MECWTLERAQRDRDLIEFFLDSFILSLDASDYLHWLVQ
jgi:hypothetical protein